MARKNKILDVEDIPLPQGDFCTQGVELEAFDAAKKRAVDSFERAYLQMLLVESAGSVVQAARRAGKSRTALWNILRKHHISPKQFCCGSRLR